MYLHTMVTQLIFSLHLPKASPGFPRQLCVFALEMMAAHYASFSDCGPFGGPVQPYVNWRLSAQGHISSCHVFRKNNRGINSCVLVTLNTCSHTYMHIINTCTNAHTPIVTHTYMHNHTQNIYACIHICTIIHIITQTYTCTIMQIFTHTQSNTHTITQTCIHLQSHTQKHTDIYIYTKFPWKSPVSLAILHFASETQIFNLWLSSASWKKKKRKSPTILFKHQKDNFHVFKLCICAVSLKHDSEREK